MVRSCPQLPYPPPWRLLLPELVGTGEDCLTLNVWSSCLGSARQPVMVEFLAMPSKNGGALSEERGTFRDPRLDGYLLCGQSPCPPKPALTCPFDLALQRRRSAALSGPIAPGQLGTLLAFTAGLQGTNVTDSNRPRRYVGSFGALHPTHILIGTASHSRGAYLPLSMLLEYCKLRGGRTGFCDRKPRLVRPAGMQS